MISGRWTAFAALAAMLGLTACAQEEASSTQPVAAPDAPSEAQADDWAAEAPNGRLPTDVRPTAYTLDMTIDPREARYAGSVAIDIEIDEARDHIWLHGNALTVEEAWLETAAGDRVEARYDQVLETGVSRISLARAIEAGRATLHITYNAPFDPNLAGLFRVEREGEWYALAKSESIQARRAVPGWDEPGFKAPWDISLTVPEGQAAISIAPEISREPAGEGMERVTFETSRPTSTYLLSLAVGPFERIDMAPLPPNEIRDWALPVTGWARQGKAEELEFILSLTQSMVETFERMTGTPYPYRKLDIIAAPDWPSGATELASAPTYREDIILSDGRPGAVQERRIVGIHAHELAHMWFGDLVTPPWWDDLWLKEGFATWGTPVAGHAWNPEGGYDLRAVTDAIDGLNADALASARAVREPITRNEDIRSAYDGITYDKGSAILRMAQYYLGPERWTAGLAAYIAEFEDAAADADDFSRVMGEAAGDPAFEASLNGFLNQNGAPLLTVSRSETGLDFQISRYEPLGSPMDGERDWIVPVCVRHEHGSDCGLIGDGSRSIALTGGAPAWFMPNANGAGYFRFVLSEADWAALAANFDQLDASEALMTLDSAAAGFEAGQVTPGAVLDLIAIASENASLDVRWEAASLLSRYIGRLYEGEDDDAARDAARAHARALFADQYGALAEAEGGSERLYRQRLRGFVAGTARDPDLRGALADAAARFVGLDSEVDTGALSADDYGLAASIAVDELGAPFVEAFLANREAINIAAFERSALSAAGRVDDDALQARLRAMALAGELEPSQAYSVVASMMVSDDHRPATWDWIRANAETIASRVPSQWRRRVPALARNFCDTSRIAELDAFMAEAGDLFPGHERGVAQASERIGLCAAFRAEKAAPYAAALAERL